MVEARYMYAVSTINFEDVREYCNDNMQYMINDHLVSIGVLILRLKDFLDGLDNNSYLHNTPL